MSITSRKGAYVTAPGTTYNNVTASSSRVQALSASASAIRVAVNADTWLALGSSVAYAANATLIPSGGVEFFAVNASSSVAYLQVSASGNISISELG